MSFFITPSAGEYSDTLIRSFGTYTFVQKTQEFAPTILQLAFSAATVGVVSLRIFLAPFAGAPVKDQIEIFNQTLTLGAIPVGQYVTLLGGQGGCERVWRDAITGVAWGLRATSTGLVGVSSNFRGEDIWARGVT